VHLDLVTCFVARRPLRMVVSTILLAGGQFLFSTHLNATSGVALIDCANNRLVIVADCRVDRDSGSRSSCKMINEAGCAS
jgi:hypothetical protein